MLRTSATTRAHTGDTGSDMATEIIAFIGGGNMASSLIGGLASGGHPASGIRVADPDERRRRNVTERFAVAAFEDNAEAVANADVVVLAVKPQIMSEVVSSVAKALSASRPLVISVAAGVRARDIARWLGYEAAIVRTMPNTPALLGVGAAGLCANAQVTDSQRDSAQRIMDAVGITTWVQEESLLDAVTAVSGSGPAYFFLLMEMMVKAGQELGLDEATTRQLTLQTALGAARMALESGSDPQTLRRQVTSPGGTTERGINSFLANDFERNVAAALTAARDRAVELADLLGKE